MGWAVGNTSWAALGRLAELPAYEDFAGKVYLCGYRSFCVHCTVKYVSNCIYVMFIMCIRGWPSGCWCIQAVGMSGGACKSLCGYA